MLEEVSNRSLEPRVRVEPDFQERWPGAEALATECLLNIGSTVKQMGALAEPMVRRHGFSSLAAFDALAAIDREGGPVLPSIVARRVIVSRPTMTGVIRSLERRGLINRMPHPKDGRMQLLEITSKGRELVRQVRFIMHQGERVWMSALTREEQRTLLGMLAKLQANTPGTHG